MITDGDAEAGRTLRHERMLPLYEAKMLHQYDHRWATYDGTVDAKGNPAARDVTQQEKQDPSFAALPRYWVAADEVQARLGQRWDRDWLMGGATSPAAPTSGQRSLVHCRWRVSGTPRR